MLAGDAAFSRAAEDWWQARMHAANARDRRADGGAGPLSAGDR